MEELISRKRPIDVVHFIQAFGLGETFPVVPILTSHLEDPQDFWEYDTEKNISQVYYAILLILAFFIHIHASFFHIAPIITGKWNSTFLMFATKTQH